MRRSLAHHLATLQYRAPQGPRRRLCARAIIEHAHCAPQPMSACKQLGSECALPLARTRQASFRGLVAVEPSAGVVLIRQARVDEAVNQPTQLGQLRLGVTRLGPQVPGTVGEDLPTAGRREPKGRGQLSVACTAAMWPASDCSQLPELSCPTCGLCAYAAHAPS